MPLSLYQIDHDLLALEAEIIENGGEVTEETEARLDELLDQREDKADRYIAVIRTYEAEARAYKEEADRLTALRRSAENRVASLKARLLASMEARDEKKIDGRLGSVTVQRSGSVPTEILVDLEDLPERFLKRSVSADTAAIKAALKEGDEEAGKVARLGEGSTYVRIR